jgi:sensor histidine kinase regulating citrate/malate metabolism
VHVRDTGSAVAPAVVRTLFREPVDRDGSLGIGLYHAARQALQAGYRVELAENSAGAVCFVLSGAPALGG